MSDNIHNNKLQILGKLAASLSHEIRNPLSVLKLNLEYLKLNNANYDEETKECIEASLQAANRMKILIENTLEFSRKNLDVFEICSINNIVKNAIKIVKGKADRKIVSININLDDSFPLLKINKDKILQVVLNLLTNAIDASFDNSNIYVNTIIEKEYAILEVIDCGIGIDDADKSKIFNDFFTKKINGTGLGLGVCKSILEEHNAEISFKPNEINGTCFYIKFPLNRIEANNEP